MDAAPPPPPGPPPPPAPQAGRPWRVLFTVIIAALVILAGLTAFWYVTGSGPFGTIQPSDWAFSMTQVTDLHARSLDGTGVTVCIVDSGFDAGHPELQHVRLVAWHDFVNGRVQPYDDESHGTAMAGIIFARGQLRGVAPEANLIAVKAIAASGSGTDRNIADAIDFCADPNGDLSLADGADVISLSLGGGSHPFLGSATETAVDRAMDAGILVVAAAGNDGQNDDGDVESPAFVSRVIAVGAVDRQGVIAPFSSMGNNARCSPPFPSCDPNEKPEVVAPGLEIATVLNGGRYAYVSGTSPAAAIVSGLVALLLQAHGQYRHAAGLLGPFKASLAGGAAPAAGQQVPHDDHYGYGIVKGLATDALL